MASHSFDPKTSRARIFFRHDGRQYNRTIKVDSRRAAERLAALVEETILDIQRGKLEVPEGCDLVEFVVTGGKKVVVARTFQREASNPSSPATSPSLESLFERYRSDPPQHLEPTTRRMQEIHFRRILELYPKATLESFRKAEAQSYISQRSKQEYRGRPIQRETIAKELQTFRQAWAWVSSRSDDLPPPSFALRELSFPKASAKLPFMTWTEIERELSRGGLSAAEIKEHWDCLWLSKTQVDELLEFVRDHAQKRFIHPMFVAAALTGARRSELCRSRIADWRLDGPTPTVQLRQKKRDRDRDFSMREIPIHPRLAEVIRGWFGNHPGGTHAFCHEDKDAITWNAAAHHFGEVLAGSKWSVVRGWHVLRHSFASNLAAAGVDQRKIDRWMGHSTEIRWRYQHIRQEDMLDAIGVL